MRKLISWVEIPAVNMERAVDFYQNILNIELEILDFGKEKMACFPNDEGAISEAPDFSPSNNGALISFGIEGDLSDLLKTVEPNGGKIVRGKTKIEAEGRGYFALIIDSEGNKISLYQD